MPLVQGRTGIHDLVIDAGYRYSDYSTAGRADTWKVELQYAPIPDLRFRGSFQHAIRAPNIIELFNPQAYGQQSFLGVDPCAPLAGQPATAHARGLHAHGRHAGAVRRRSRAPTPSRSASRTSAGR